MLHALAPRHFRDMNKAFDSGLQFNEGTVVGQVHNFSGNAGAHRIDLLDQRPRIGRELLIAKRYAFLVAIVFQNLDGDLVADIEHLRWMVHTSPGKIRYVKQSVDSAQINEHSVIRNVLHDAADVGILFQHLQREGLLAGLLVFQNNFA